MKRFLVLSQDISRGDFNGLSKDDRFSFRSINYKRLGQFTSKKRPFIWIKIEVFLNIIIYFPAIFRAQYFMTTNWRFRFINEFSSMLRILGLKTIILNREGFSFSEEHISTISERYQETSISSYDYFFFGNSFSQNLFNQSYGINGDRHLITGYARYDEYKPFTGYHLEPENIANNKELLVCITDAVLDKVEGSVEIIERFIRLALADGWKVTLKMKAKQKFKAKERALLRAMRAQPKGFVVDASDNALSVIQNSQVVVTGYSQVIPECLLLGKPALVIKSRDSNSLNFGGFGGTVKLISLDELKSLNTLELFLKALAQPKMLNAVEQEFVEKSLGPMKEKTADLIYDFLGENT